MEIADKSRPPKMNRPDYGIGNLHGLIGDTGNTFQSTQVEQPQLPVDNRLIRSPAASAHPP